MKYLILFFLSTSAMAACQNLINVSDAQKMVAGQSHGKDVLICDQKPCVCLDGCGVSWFIETSDMVQSKDGSWSFVPNKEKVAEAQAEKDAAKQKLADDQAMKDSLSGKIKDGSATMQELLEYVKAKDGL